jgi:hypothetical protein
MKTSDIATICSVIAAVCSVMSAPLLEKVFPGNGTYIAGVLAVVGLAAGQITRTLTNKTGAPTEAIGANAVIVPQGTNVVNSSTPVIATNVTTTSTDPIVAPQKGAT